MIRFPRFRFRLVHLFVLLTIVCGVIAHLGREIYVANRVIARVDELGGLVYWEPTRIGNILEYISVHGGVLVTDVEFRAATYLPPFRDDVGMVSELYLLSSDLEDEGLAKLIPELARLSAPFKLRLIGTSVSDAAMKGLVDMTALEGLDLSGTRITDEGITNLTGAIGLRKLNVSDTEVTDQAIPDLLELELTELDVSFTLMTREGIQKLRESMPDCEISAKGFDERTYSGGRRNREYGGVLSEAIETAQPPSG